jgi:hypothetical protein
MGTCRKLTAKDGLLMMIHTETAVSRGGGSRFLLGKGKDLGQRADNNDLTMTTPLAWIDFDPIHEGTDDLDSLGACRRIVQHLLQPGDLSAVEVGEIGMDLDLRVAPWGLQMLSKGIWERLKVCPETLEVLAKNGIKAEVLQTKAAVERFNELRESMPVGGLFHSTC